MALPVLRRPDQQLGLHAAAARMLRHAATASAAPWLLVSAGFSLQELKRHAEAVEVYREFLALVEIRQVLAADPENADALRAIVMLEQAGGRRAKRPWWRFWN